MILKLIGSVLVVCSTVLAGIYYGNLETYRANELLELKKALAILKSEIEFAQAPLPQALISILSRTEKSVKKIFGSFEEALHVERNKNIGELWEEAVGKHLKESFFSKEDSEQIISFGKALGYLDKGMQESNIQIAINYIDEQLHMLNETRYKNKKMFQSFGVLFGILIVIIFM